LAFNHSILASVSQKKDVAGKEVCHPFFLETLYDSGIAPWAISLRWQGAMSLSRGRAAG
jgi:hypothetical protein